MPENASSKSDDGSGTGESTIDAVACRWKLVPNEVPSNNVPEIAPEVPTTSPNGRLNDEPCKTMVA